MLKRIVTGLILSLIALSVLFFASSPVFTVLWTLTILLAAWEWTLLIGLHLPSTRWFYVFFMTGLQIVFFTIMQKLPIVFFLWIVLVWWVFATILIITYPKHAHLWSKGILIRSLMGIIVLVPVWFTILHLRFMSQEGLLNLFFLLIIVWSTDIGAYFTGKSVGVHKLLPQVSPKKTVEGVIGGLSVSLIIVLFMWSFLFSQQSLGKMIGITIATAIFSIIGDLFESMLKREVGIKDTGHFLPGHGGILDRIDSLTAAAPIFLLLIQL